jgi:SNF2 family DNA or RNA helicase
MMDEDDPANAYFNPNDPCDLSATQLKPHQVEGVRWLTSRRRGILADDMGLGKTLQLVITVCFLLRKRRQELLEKSSAFCGKDSGNAGPGASQPGDHGRLQETDGLNRANRCGSGDRAKDYPAHPKGTGVGEGSCSPAPLPGSPKALILAPKSLVAHWRDEFHQHVHPEYRPSIGTQYHQLGKCDVLILNYEQYRLHRFRHGRGSLKVPLAQMNFEVVVLDEAHMIRNSSNQCCSSVLSIEARHRYCLTGTPINNSLDDLLTLCRFMRVPPYHKAEWWNKNRHDERAMRIWRSQFFLRREKSILQLCPATEETLHIPFSEDERRVYEEVLRGLVQQYDVCVQRHQQAATPSSAFPGTRRKPPAGKTGFQREPLNSSQLSHLLVLTLRLRQWCNHPRLAIPDSKIPSSKTLRLKEELEQMVQRACASRKRNRSGQLRLQPEDLDRLPKTVIFSQWSQYLDIVEQEVLKPLGLPFLRLDGKLTMEQRGSVVRQFQHRDATEKQGECQSAHGEPASTASTLGASPGGPPIFLATTKAGGLGLNLTNASQVFLMDYWFNPFVDLQAVNRVHRIGQSQPVRVVRFEVADTLETQIRKLQVHKERQAAEILATDRSQAGDPEPGGSSETFTRGSLSLLQLGRLLGKTVG